MTELPQDFVPEDYLALHHDLRVGAIDPCEHYLKYGAAEGRPYKKNKHATKDRIEELAKTCLFDAAFYRKKYKDSYSYEISGDEHYLEHGSDLGWWPNNFFRTNWYVERYSKFFTWAYHHPIFHYTNDGYEKGFMPCPFFEPAYYLEQYGDEIGDEEPLKHFLREGHTGRFNPSSRFDSTAYLRAVPNAWPTNPLEHYITEGIHRGILPQRPSAPLSAERVTSANLRFVKRGNLSRQIALMVTHTPDGVIKPYATHYAAQLKKAGMSVYMIVASDKDIDSVSIPSETANACSVVCVRENIGWDFAAWSHILQISPEIYQAYELLLTNDSIAGPAGDISDIFHRIREMNTDVTGLVINDDYTDHLQSFFLHFKKSALTNSATTYFFERVINQNDKDLVIVDYEITLTNFLRANGLSCEPLFNISDTEGNKTILHWRNLLDSGFPFLKITALKAADPTVQSEMLRALRDKGYDISLLPFGPMGMSKHFPSLAVKLRERLAGRLGRTST
ncbi:Lipopolysaccharide biosynthesis protein [Ochrobactrum sp. J50]|uniref:rhamnan synthesis F family protein n=1 Tax=Ochrobactrum sp. J50 TaxID=936132 RepID=UPI0011A5A18A|nr:rhamnan synthesis F family protein [Ochrobactrum sp. J50]TWH02324.1 Lipopolysaccharide biosynthesis protein [Ochrobactrum sp. J50]